MLGRRDSCSSYSSSSSSSTSSSSSPLTSPTDALPHPIRPSAPRSHRLAKSESFKALLLRKGRWSDPTSRVSAVERLRKVHSPTYDHKRAPSLLQPPDRVKPTLLSHMSNEHDLTEDKPPSPTCLFTKNLSVTLRQRDVRQNHFFFTSSSSPFFFLSSSSSMQPRALTPPCFSSRRFASRSQLFVAPMTAIFEGESEEEVEEKVEDEVFVESCGTNSKTKGLVETIS